MFFEFLIIAWVSVMIWASGYIYNNGLNLILLIAILLEIVLSYIFISAFGVKD